MSSEKKIIILAASGFEENHMASLQRALTQASLSFKVVAPEQGLINGWQDNAWGHYFPVDAQINVTMGSDYDAMILVGGERGVLKLRSNPHTRRLVNHFIDAQKPLSAIGAGVGLLALGTGIAGRTIAAEDAARTEFKEIKVSFVEAEQNTDGMILTAADSQAAAWVASTVSLIEGYEVPLEEAA